MQATTGRFYVVDTIECQDSIVDLYCCLLRCSPSDEPISNFEKDIIMASVYAFKGIRQSKVNYFFFSSIMAFSSRLSLLTRHLHNSTLNMTTEKATFAAGCFW